MTKITDATLEKFLDIAIRALDAERKVDALERRVQSLLDQNSKLREHNARIFSEEYREGLNELKKTRTIHDRAAKGDD